MSPSTPPTHVVDPPLTSLHVVEDPTGVREAVAVFETSKALQTAIDDLLSSGFDRAELSLLASEHAVDETLGYRSSNRHNLEDDPSVPRGSYVSPEAISAAEGGLISGLAYLGGVVTAGVIAAAGGPLTAIVVGAALAGGAGGIMGTGLAEIVGHRRAAYFEDQLHRGGLLLWVRTWNAERERRAVDILARHCGHDVHVHDFPEFTRAADAAASAQAFNT